MSMKANLPFTIYHFSLSLNAQMPNAKLMFNVQWSMLNSTEGRA